MLEIGETIQDRYRIDALIGQGGMGAVYRAQDLRLGRTCAVKEMLLPQAEAARAFTREARLLATLHHPALPAVIDYFAADARQCLVMEYIPGEDLETLLVRRGAPFPLPVVLRWADQLLDALSYLHAQQPPVIHRDIKPHNIKLAGEQHVILLDFGIAKGYQAEPDAPASSLHAFTPAFAPLEQMQRSAPTDARADLYALAATLLRLLTNTMPPDALQRAAAAISGAPDPLQPPSALNAALPAALDPVFTRALALDPAQRYQDASALRAALRAVAEPQAGAALNAPLAATLNAGAVTPQLAEIHATDAETATLAAGADPAAAPPQRRTRRAPWRGLALVLGGIGVLALLLLLRPWDALAPTIVRSPERVTQVARYGSGALNGARLLPNGDLLAISSLGWATYDWTTGRRLAAFEPDSYRPLAFSRDAGFWATTSPTDTTVLLWSRASNTVVARLSGHGIGVNRAAFSPDGRYLATGDVAGQALLWRVPDGAKVADLRYQDRRFVTKLAWSADSQQLAVVSLYAIELFQLSDPSRALPIAEVGEFPGDASFSPDGAQLAVAYGPASEAAPLIKLFDTRARAVVRTVPLPGEATTIQFSPDGAQLLVAQERGQVQLLDVRDGKVIRDLTESTPRTGASFSLDGSQVIVTQPERGEARVYRSDSGQRIGGAAGFTWRPELFALRPDGQQYALLNAATDSVTTTDTVVSLYAADGQLLRRLDVGAPVQSLSYLGDGVNCVTSTGRELILWNSNSGQEQARFRQPDGPIHTFAASPDGQRLRSVGLDGRLVTWNVQSGKQEDAFQLEGREFYSSGGLVNLPPFVAVKPDGSEAVVLNAKTHELTRWSLANRRETGRFRLEQIELGIAVAYRPGSDQVALLDVDKGVVWLVSLTDGTIVQTLDGHRQTHYAIGALTAWQFTPDGLVLITAGRDGSVILWNATTGQELRQLIGHSDDAVGVGLTADGRRLYSAGWDGVVRRWEVR